MRYPCRNKDANWNDVVASKDSRRFEFARFDLLIIESRKDGFESTCEQIKLAIGKVLGLTEIEELHRLSPI